MASLIDENTQFLDSAGSPIVNGYIYVGTQNLDPVTNTITIYSDRELTVSISNPQRTDANGRSTNKIWVPAKYSLKVEDENNVQQYLEPDNGEIEQTGISLLTNVQGTNTITAEGAPAITSLVDNQQYNFRAANTNTGTVTLQIDLTAAKTIKKRHDVNLAAGDIEQNQTVSVVYNAVDDVFELVSNVTIVEATRVAFPATQVPSADVNTLDDYEEGTWTPTLQDDSKSDAESQGYNMSFTAASYTKIGNVVHVAGRMFMTSTGSLTGGSAAYIANLPFTSKSTPANVTQGEVTFGTAVGLNITAGQVVTGTIAPSQTVIALNLWDAGIGTTEMTISEVSSNGELYFSGTYFAA